MDMDQMMEPALQQQSASQQYSVGVPIPGRQQWQFSGPEFTEMRAGRPEPELGTSAGAAASYPPPTDYGSSPSPGAAWPLHAELAQNLAGIQIDDFEDVDVADLINGPMREPTLAELNTGEDLNDLALDFAAPADPFGSPAPPPVVKTELLDAPVKSEWSFSSSIPASFAPQMQPRPPLVGQHDPMLPSFPAVGGAEPRRAAGTSGGRLTLHSLLAQPAASRPGAGQAGRLSSSVPCESQLEARLGPAARLGPMAAVGRMDELRGSSSSVSTGVLSPGSHDSFVDEAAESPYDHYSDSDSDEASTVGDEPLSSSLGRVKERYFWQYNVQAKGPKGQRIQLTEDVNDPHQISQAIDPVFSASIKMEGIKHSGKARRGDGNDLTPSPRKLLNIQRDLDKLNRRINDMTPVSELPFNVRPKSRKEKNKLASRACRLKKKAQHEANKIQLSGLGEEHRRLTSALRDMQEALRARLLLPADGAPTPSADEAAQAIERALKHTHKHRVAGHLPEYVERTLDRYRAASSSAHGGSEPALAHTELG